MLEIQKGSAVKFGKRFVLGSSLALSETADGLPLIDTVATSPALDGLTDVTITAPAGGQYLRYNGSQWVNIAIQAGDLPPIGPTGGGTGLSSFVTGDIIYANATNTLAALAGNITTTRKFLRQTGNGSISAAPAWDTLTAADVGAGSFPAGAFTIPTSLVIATDPGGAQIFRVGGGARFTGDIVYDGSSGGLSNSIQVVASTADASDTKRIALLGGGGASTTRGAIILVHGNEFATDPGYLILQAGDTGNIRFLGHVLAQTDNTYDLGATAATRPRTGYFGTSVVTPTLSAATLIETTGTGTFRLVDPADVTLSSTTHAFQIGLSASANIAMDSNEIMARSNGATSTLNLNIDGGNVAIGASLVPAAAGGGAIGSATVPFGPVHTTSLQVRDSSNNIRANISDSAGSTGFELGRQDGTGGTSAFIDFHSGATVVDYETRIIGSGGNGVVGGGTLDLVGATVRYQSTSGNTRFTFTDTLHTSTVPLKFNTTNGKILGGSTDFALRNNADSANNLLLTDAGIATFRNDLTVSTLGTFDSAATPVTDYVLSYNGTKWTPRLLQVNFTSGQVVAGQLVDFTAAAYADTNPTLSGTPTAPTTRAATVAIYAGVIVDMSAYVLGATQKYVLDYRTDGGAFTSNAVLSTSNKVVHSGLSLSKIYSYRYKIRGGSDSAYPAAPNDETGTNGTATGTQTSTTLQDTSKTWTTNFYSNYSVKIVSGTGAGQIRTISSNTANTLTVSSAWTVTPVAGSSVYAVGTLPSSVSEVDAFGLIVASQIATANLSAINANLGIIVAGAVQDANPNPTKQLRFSTGVAPDPDTVTGMVSYIDFPSTTNFMRIGQPAVAISSSTAVNPSVVTTGANHGYTTGDRVTIRGHATNTAINGSWTITVTGLTTFTVPVLGIGAGTGGSVVKLTLTIDGPTGALNVYGNIQAETFTALGAATFYSSLTSLGGATFTSANVTSSLRSLGPVTLVRTLQHSLVGEYGDTTVNRILMENAALTLMGDAGVGQSLEVARLGSYSVATSAVTPRTTAALDLPAAGSRGWYNPSSSDANGINTLSHSGNTSSTVAAGNRLYQKLGITSEGGVEVDAYDDRYKLGFRVDARYLTGGNPNAVVTSTVTIEYSTDSGSNWIALSGSYIVNAGGTSSGYSSAASAVFTPYVTVTGAPTHLWFRLIFNLTSSILDSTYHSGTSDGTAYCYASTYKTNNYAATWSTSSGASQYRRGLRLNKIHAPEQLSNRDFELGAANWVAYAGAISVITDATKAHSGANYLQVTSSGAAFAGASQVDNLGATVYVPVTPGDVVTFGGWAYRESGTSSVYYVINAYDASKVFVTGVTTALVTTAAWTQITNTYTVPASGVSYIAFFPEVNNVSSTVARFDDATLVVGLGDVPHLYLEPADVVADPVDGLEGEVQFVGGGTDGPHALAYHDGVQMRPLPRLLLASNASSHSSTGEQLLATTTIKARHMNALGRVLRLRFSGKAGVNGSVVNIKINSSTVGTALTLTANQSFSFDYVVTTGATGASGRLDYGGYRAQATTFTSDEGNISSFDLTSDLVINFNGQVTTSGTVTCRVATVEWQATN